MTKEGEKVLPSFQIIAQEEARIQRIAKSIVGLEESKLSLGVISSVGISYLPDILKGFLKLYPQVEYECFPCTYETVQNGISDGMIDCGFLSSFVKNNELEFIPLWEDEFVVLIPRGRALSQKEELDIEEIKSERMILVSGEEEHDLNKIFEEHNIRPDIAMRSTDAVSALKLVEKGFGIGIFSKVILEGIEVWQNVEVRHFTKHYSRVLGLAIQKGQMLSPTSEKFVRYVQEYSQVENR